MIPFTTLRQFYRIPLVKQHKEAVHTISDLFQLLIGLFRVRRRLDFCNLQNIFFLMIDSFAQYGRSEAKETVDLIVKIPWFHMHQRDLYRAIVSYNRVIEIMKVMELQGPCLHKQDEINRNFGEFIESCKVLMDFNERDEARVAGLLAQPNLVDAILDEITETLGNKQRGLNYNLNASPHVSPGNETIAQKFGFTRDYTPQGGTEVQRSRITPVVPT